LDLRPHRKRWVLRFDAFNQRRSFQLTTHAHGISRHRGRRRWGWWRRRQICEDSTDNATKQATGNPSLNITRNSVLTVGINVRLLDDLSRGLDRRSPRAYGRHWLDSL